MNSISIVKAAELKGCNRQTIYRWMEADKLNTIKDSKRLKIVLDEKFNECEAKGPEHKIKNLNETIDDLKKEQERSKAKIKDLELAIEEIKEKLNQCMIKISVKPEEIKNIPDKKEEEVSEIKEEEIKSISNKKVSNLSDLEGFHIHQGKKNIFYGTKRIGKKQHKVYIGKNVEDAEKKIKKYKEKNNIE